MRKFRALLGLIATLMVMGLALTINGASATAVDNTIDRAEYTGSTKAATDNVGAAGDPYKGAWSGAMQECNSRKRDFLNIRRLDTSYSYPHATGFLELSDAMIYRYCPNGDMPDKAKPLKIIYCHKHTMPENHAIPANFSGVEFDTDVIDTNTFYATPRLFLAKAIAYIGEKPRDRKCSVYEIPKEKRKWFRIDQYAYYVTSFQIDIQYFDEVGGFITSAEDNNDEKHYFNPYIKDDPVSEWYGTEPTTDPIYTFPELPVSTPAPTCLEPNYWDQNGNCVPPFSCPAGKEVYGLDQCVEINECWPRMENPDQSCSDWPVYDPNTGCATSGGCNPNYPVDEECNAEDRDPTTGHCPGVDPPGGSCDYGEKDLNGKCPPVPSPNSAGGALYPPVIQETLDPYQDAQDGVCENDGYLEYDYDRHNYYCVY